MQNITISCGSLILIAFVSFFSQEVIQSYREIIRDPVSEEAYPALSRTLRFGSLFEQKSENEVVRFTVYRSFEEPLWITLNLNERKMAIESRSFKESDINNRRINFVVKLDSEYVERVKDEITSSYLAEKTPKSEASLDGSDWIIELTWSGKYYTSNVGNPHAGPEYQLGHLLFERAEQYVSLGTLY